MGKFTIISEGKETTGTSPKYTILDEPKTSSKFTIVSTPKPVNPEYDYSSGKPKFKGLDMSDTQGTSMSTEAISKRQATDPFLDVAGSGVKGFARGGDVINKTINRGLSTISDDIATAYANKTLDLNKAKRVKANWAPQIPTWKDNEADLVIPTRGEWYSKAGDTAGELSGGWSAIGKTGLVKGIASPMLKSAVEMGMYNAPTQLAEKGKIEPLELGAQMTLGGIVGKAGQVIESVIAKRAAGKALDDAEKAVAEMLDKLGVDETYKQLNEMPKALPQRVIPLPARSESAVKEGVDKTFAEITKPLPTALPEGSRAIPMPPSTRVPALKEIPKKSRYQAVMDMIEKTKKPSGIVPEELAPKAEGIAKDATQTASQQLKTATPSVPESIIKPSPIEGKGVKGVEPLIEEAKKYKSADEFVKSFKRGFHGTASEFDKLGFGTGVRTNGMMGAKDIQSNAIFFSSDKDVADFFAKNRAEYFSDTNRTAKPRTIEQLIKITKPADFSTPKKAQAVLDKAGISLDNEIFGIEDMGTRLKDEIDAGRLKLSELPMLLDKPRNIEKLKAAGYDGAITVETAGGKESKGYAVFDPKQLYDKNKLTDIWNKAHSTPSITEGGKGVKGVEGMDAIDTIKASWKNKGITEARIFEGDKTIHLDTIVVPKGSRGKGIGTSAMKELTDYADSVGKEIVLKPDTSHGASSLGRLERFYEGLGFKKNVNKAKDPYEWGAIKELDLGDGQTTRSTNWMFREPKLPTPSITEGGKGVKGVEGNKVLSDLAKRTQNPKFNKITDHNGYTEQELAPLKPLVDEFGKVPSKEEYIKVLENKYGKSYYKDIANQTVAITPQEAINLQNLEEFEGSFSMYGAKAKLFTSLDEPLATKGRFKDLKVRDLYKTSTPSITVPLPRSTEGGGKAAIVRPKIKTAPQGFGNLGVMRPPKAGDFIKEKYGDRIGNIVSVKPRKNDIGNIITAKWQDGKTEVVSGSDFDITIPPKLGGVKGEGIGITPIDFEGKLPQAKAPKPMNIIDQMLTIPGKTQAQTKEIAWAQTKKDLPYFAFGIEPDYDKDGKIKGYKYNLGKGLTAFAMGGMARRLGGGGGMGIVEREPVNVNMYNLKEEAKNVIRGTAKELGINLERDKGVLKNITIEEMAKQAELLKRAIGTQDTAKLAAQVLATRQQLAKISQGTGITKEEMGLFKNIYDISTHTARMLQAQGIKVDPLLHDGEMQVSKLDLVKKLLSLGTKSEDIMKAAEKVDFTNANQVTEFYRKFVKPTLPELIDEYRYINLLSSPRTHIVNTFSNIVQASILAPATRLINGGIDAVGSTLTGQSRKVWASEVPAYYKGVVNALPDAIKGAFKALKGESPMFRPDINKIPTGSKLLKPFMIIPRALEASDVFFQGIMRGGEKEALSLRALKQGKNIGDKAVQSGIDEQARKTAEYYVFRKPPDATNKTGQGTLLSGIDKITSGVYALRRVPGVKWFVPFVMTPMNILKQGIEYSPLGFATMGKNTANNAEQASKAIIGSMVFTGAGYLALTDRTTWAVPTGKERELFYATGRKPYAVKIGDTWVEYSKLGPLSYPIALAAAAKWYALENPKTYSKATEQKVAASLLGIAKFFSDQSYVEGLSNLLELGKGEEYAWEQASAGVIGQMIPLSSLQRWVTGIIDPIYRKPQTKEIIPTIGMQVAKGIPGLSTIVPPIKSSIGTAQRKPLPYFNAVSPIGLSPQGTGEFMYKDYLRSARQKEKYK